MLFPVLTVTISARDICVVSRCPESFYLFAHPITIKIATKSENKRVGTYYDRTFKQRDILGESI